MKKLILTALCLVFVAGTALADWQPGNPHKMTLPQLPDPFGWDVHFEHYYVADDFECSESGPLRDIHFWISWQADDIGDVTDWYIYIYGDDSGLQPDLFAQYWMLSQPYDYEVVPAGTGFQGWLDPNSPPGIPNDHTQYFQVNITNIQQPFIQTQGEVYWLLIRTPFVIGDQNVGWKTTFWDTFFGSPALFLLDIPSWLWLPVDVDGYEYFVDMAFVVTNDQRDPIPGDNCSDPLAVSLGLGDLPWSDSNTTCFRGNYYQNTCLNLYDDGEDIIYELTITEAMTVDITLDPLGTQYTGIAIDDVCPPDGTCLGSSTSASASPHKIEGVYLAPGLYYIMIDTWPVPYCITNFVLTISETPHGACCLNTGDCEFETENACDALGGLWQGPETVCEPNPCEGWYCDSTWSDCIFKVDYINKVMFNTINNLSGSECATESYGDYTYLSTQVNPKSTHTLSVSFISAIATGYVRAWVDWNQDFDFDDPGEQYDLGSGFDTTVSTDITVPLYALPGPTRMRVTEKLNGYAGPCENGTTGETEDYTVEVNDIQDIAKWVQLPDLSSEGMDVNATKPAMLGDDFECTQPGFVTEIGIWASWLNDVLPSGDPNAVVFTLKIYSDDPCGAGGYSEPNELLWEQQLAPGEFEVVRYAEGLDEGWYDPNTSIYTPSADTVCWWYNFNFNSCEAFFQRGTANEPIVYWLVVQAEPTLPSTRFGWKNSIDYWNDAAVASFDDGQSWSELEQPPGTNLDMAFMIIGKPPSADLNRDGIVDFEDFVFFASQWLTSGP